MDWPSHLDPFVAPNGFGDFAYDFQSAIHCRVLQQYSVNPGGAIHTGIEKIILTNNDRWNQFEESAPIFPHVSGDEGDGQGEEEDNGSHGGSDGQEEAEIPLVPISQLPSGVCIFFCPRATKVFKDIPPNLSDLAMSKAWWRKIATTFHLHGVLSKAIRRKTTMVSSINYGVTERIGNDIHHDTLSMHIMASSEEWRDSFAMASTHFRNRKLTFAVVLGATLWQMRRAKELLEQSEDAIGHPLLMLGLCAELQLERAKRLVEKKVDECIDTTRKLEGAFRDQDGSTRSSIDLDLINQVRDRQFASGGIVEELRAVKRHLAKALRQSRKNGGEGNNDGEGNEEEDGEGIEEEEDEDGEGNEEADTAFEPEFHDNDGVTGRFYQRFADILAEFEALMAKSRRYANNMSETASIIRAELARREAQATVKAAEVSTVLAFVAMLYLPMTTLATIFAMPVFQFQSHWLDWKFHFVGKPNSTDSSSASNTGSPPVFSGYFWIYLIFAVVLTTITIEGWWRFTSGEQRRTHWVVYLVVMIVKHIRDSADHSSSDNLLHPLSDQDEEPESDVEDGPGPPQQPPPPPPPPPADQGPPASPALPVPQRASTLRLSQQVPGQARHAQGEGAEIELGKISLGRWTTAPTLGGKSNGRLRNIPVSRATSDPVVEEENVQLKSRGVSDRV